MKKAIVYTVLPVFLLSFAAGCGMADRNERLPSPTPMITATPTTMPTPDVGNGVVNDRDGVITPEDNGTTPSATATPRPGKTTPGTTPSATPNM